MFSAWLSPTLLVVLMYGCLSSERRQWQIVAVNKEAGGQAGYGGQGVVVERKTESRQTGRKDDARAVQRVADCGDNRRSSPGSARGDAEYSGDDGGDEGERVVWRRMGEDEKEVTATTTSSREGRRRGVIDCADGTKMGTDGDEYGMGQVWDSKSVGRRAGNDGKQLDKVKAII